MAYQKKDIHRFYDFTVDIFENSKYKIGTIKTLHKTRRFIGKFHMLSYVFMLIDIFYLPISAYRLKSQDFIFIREFNTLTFCFSAIFLFPIRKKILLNINHNFQRFEHRLLHRYCLKFISVLGFSFVFFEYDKFRFSLKSKVLSIPFLIKDINLPHLNKPRLTFGVVGSYRKEKQMEALLDSLLMTQKDLNNFDIVFACDNQQILDEFKEKNITLLNTSDFDDYNSALNSTDVLLFNYSEFDYKIRHSGVITDAISKGKIVISPDFPVFSEQLSTPVSVGVCFKNISSLNQSVKDAMNLYYADGLHDKFRQYFEFRTLYSISKELDFKLALLIKESSDIPQHSSNK